METKEYSLIKDTMYYNYMKESLGTEVLENEYGFVLYCIEPDDCCYIQDIYILPKFRKKYAASKIANEVASIGKKQGCNILKGCVAINKPFFEVQASVAVLEGYGMEYAYTTDEYSFYIKEI
jgi:hypothetical protein